MNTTTDAVATSVQQAVGAADRFFRSGSLADYEDLNQQVHVLNGAAREALQRQWSDRFGTIIDKLEDGRHLASEERHAVEMLIVGEAEEYLRTENNFQDWQVELQRLVGELQSSGASGLSSEDELLRVQSLCRDARGLLPEIGFYLREKDRVDRCRSALNGDISPTDGRFLATVIRDLLSSPKR